MKKFMLILILIALMFVFGLCTPELELKTGGLYLKITSTGTYFNEITGNTSANSTTLETIVNLYPLTKSAAGYFNNGGGIITGTSSGKLDTNTVFGGVAHVNGLIAKGPLSGTSPVSISLLDANFNEVAIDPFLQEKFEDALSNLAEFNLELPATENVEIHINVNMLTTMQAKRIQTLVTTKRLSYAEAYAKSKEEILRIFNLEGIGDIKDFENTSIIGNTNSDAFLLLVSAIMSNNPNLINDIVNDIAQNGNITDGDLYVAIVESLMNLDFQNIINNLNNFYEGQGPPGVNIPDGSNYLDLDGDGNIDLYDVVLLSPVGLIYPPTTPTFEWSPLVDTTGVTYAFQVSTYPSFYPSDLIANVTGLTSPEYTGALSLNQETVYYWRVAQIVNGEQKAWAATSSFIVSSTSSVPSGSVNIVGGNTVLSRVIKLDLSGIVGASAMMFSFDGTFNSPEEQYTPFEIYKTLIMPDVQSATIYAQFSNSAGESTVTETIITVTSDKPTGTFYINDYMATQTVITNVKLNLYEIQNAYAMRFSNDNVFNSPEEQWVPFESNHKWTLLPGLGTKTVYAEFKNANGTYATSDTIELINGHTLIVEINPIDAGFAYPNNTLGGDGSAEYPFMFALTTTIVQLMLSYSPTYSFSGWSGPDAGDVVDMGSYYSILMNANKHIIANFIPTLYVSGEIGNDSNDGSAGSPLATIQEAIDRLTNGGVVKVEVGSYNVTGSPITITNDGIYLQGNWNYGFSGRLPYQTIDERIVNQTNISFYADMGSTPTNPNSAISIAGNITNKTIIEGFTINFSNYSNAGIRCKEGSSPTIRYNTINGDIGDYSVGIMCESSTANTAPLIINNYIEAGNVQGGSYNTIGIYCLGKSSPFIINNYIHGGYMEGSATGSTHGIYYKGGSSPNILNNTINGGGPVMSTGNSVIGIKVEGTGTPVGTIRNNIIFTPGGTETYYGIYEANTNSDVSVLQNNDIFNCLTALYYNEGSTAITTEAGLNSIAGTTCSGNVSTDPMFADIEGDYHLTSSSTLVSGAGLDLSSEPNFPKIDGYPIDLDLIDRTVPWSMGAYEYDTPVIDDYIAYYSFEDGDYPTVISDATTNTYEGTPYNLTTQVPSAGGGSNYAYGFDGSTTYIETGDIPFDGDFSFSVWVRPNTINVAQPILSKDANISVNNPSTSEMQLEITSDNRFRFILGSTTTGVWTEVVSETAVVSDGWTWYNVIGRVKGTKMVLDVFINKGFPERSQSIVPSRISGTEPLMIGTSNDTEDASSQTYFNGIIDELYIFNRYISDNEMYMIDDLIGLA